ncbi:MAG: hypothetical protein LBQ83_07680, partial [Candidatus Margulisbacteria bacterium]|nr:hypothetical protein [Candidatus Margulisiibacteriota bacterium]
NISLEGKNLNYTYKDLGAKGLNLFANIGSYVLKTETPAAESATVDGGGYSNANLEIQQLGIQYKIANYSIDLAYAQYAIPNWDMANYEGIRYDDNKAITEIGAKLGAALSVPYFEKAALLYDDFTNPNIETKENKATAYGIEFGTAKVAKLGDYSLRYLDRSVGQNVGWAFLDDAHAVANTKGSQITLTLGIVENVNFVIDHYAFRGISDTDNNGNELSEYARDKLNTSSTRFELNVKF